jgi:hypothetical protein
MSLQVSDDTLLELNKHGFIPGPSETPYSFLMRVKKCLQFSNTVALTPTAFTLHKSSPHIPQNLTAPPLSVTKSLFDIAPEWVPSVYSNAGLSLWQGGVSSMSPVNTDSRSFFIYLQLRKSFSHSPRFLWLYHRDELLAHEYSHIGRMAFDENKYEEILAYKTSSSALRRTLGPLALSSPATFFFIFSLLLSLSFDTLFFFSEESLWYFLSLGIKLCIASGILFLLGKVFRRHSALSRCLLNLEELTGEKKSALAVAFRLTDEEILLFSHNPPHVIATYAGEQQRSSLRWRLICRAYLSAALT